MFVPACVRTARLCCRNAICAPMYTEQELLGRVLLFHCITGRPVATFDWRVYIGRRARLQSSRASVWFVPDESVQRVAREVLEAGLFVAAPATAQWFRDQPNSGACLRWTGFKLQPRSHTTYTFVLSPFEVRVTKAESAVRLALEAQQLGVCWDTLAAKKATVR